MLLIASLGVYYVFHISESIDIDDDVSSTVKEDFGNRIDPVEHLEEVIVSDQRETTDRKDLNPSQSFVCIKGRFINIKGFTLPNVDFEVLAFKPFNNIHIALNMTRMP